MNTQSASAVSPTFTSTELAKRTLQRRGVEAAIWGLPLVSVDAKRQAFFRDAGATYGDILYLSKPADWRFQTATPAASSLYVYFNFNLKDGPVVFSIPAAIGAGVFGTLIDAWETPLVDVGSEGADKGNGGKYVLLLPDHTQNVPDGHLPVWSRTFNGYALLRVTPASGLSGDMRTAIELIRKMRVYPLMHTRNPPNQRHIDIAGALFDGIVRFDDTFYDSLARMVNEEPVQIRDFVVMAQLRSLGIEKGKAFKPDAATRDMLKFVVAEAHASFMNAATVGQPYWPGSQWSMGTAIGPKTGFTYETGDRLEIDERGITFFLAHGAPKSLGASTFYLGAFRDASGQALQGDMTYRLRIPPNVPVHGHWSLTVYDLVTAAFIRNAPRLAIESHDLKVLKNADGSIDVHFGPTAPVGRDANWIFTAPRKPWFAFFRCYGPEQAVLDKTWALPNIEKAG